MRVGRQSAGCSHTVALSRVRGVQHMGPSTRCQICWSHRSQYPRTCQVCKRTVLPGCNAERCLAQGEWCEDGPRPSICRECFASMRQAIAPLTRTLPRALEGAVGLHANRLRTGRRSCTRDSDRATWSRERSRPSTGALGPALIIGSRRWRFRRTRSQAPAGQRTFDSGSVSDARS